MPDLANIPGFTELQSITLGTPDIVIAILDGPVDLERACFQGAKLTKLAPYWQDEVAIAPQDTQTFLEIINSDDDEETKGKLLQASISDQAVISRLNCIFHSTHIISTILGQPDSPIKGIAPKCTGINIPVDITGIGNELISPLNLARAFELALEKGAHIIHCAVCIPTQTGIALDILSRSVKKCQENNILVVAPGGNDKGECWCIPAVLPGVLAVGAMKDDGQPFKFSNWGGNYQSQGILAPGENILGAQPMTDVPVRKKGTSCAAPVVTGISALLISLQLQQGQPIDAEAVRSALLNTATPCNSKEVEEPERCLGGKLNIPGAYQALTGKHLRISLQTNYTNTTSSQPSFNKRDEYLHKLNKLYEGCLQDFTDQTTYQMCWLRETDLENRACMTNEYLALQAGIKPGDVILDAGCGVGGPSVDIARKIENVKIIGITQSDAQARAANKLVQEAELGDRVQIQTGDYHYLPFANEVFDVVIFFDSIGHTYDLSKLLTEIKRVLRHRGTLYIKDAFQREDYSLEYEEKLLAEYEKEQLYKAFSMSYLCREIQRTGFQDIQSRDLSQSLATQNNALICGDIKAHKHASVIDIIQSYLFKSSVFASDLSTSLITPSAPKSKYIYALGTLRYDFGTEAQRDSFKELMPAVNIDGIVVPSNPYNARQMVNYLRQNPSEGYSLIWTLNMELNPLYAIEAKGAFSEDIYEILQTLLAGAVAPEDSDDYIERVSIPARHSDRTVKLLSGQLVPVIEIWDVRGIYGWKVNTLVSAALDSVRVEAENISSDSLRHSIISFLNRVYYDLQNLGQTSRDRALNFAATNIVQAASIFAKAIVLGMELDSIEMEKSPFCRIDSDCWDVKLKFFDPENCRLAQKIFRFTIDVQDSLPVTLGKVKSWSIPKWEE